MQPYFASDDDLSSCNAIKLIDPVNGASNGVKINQWAIITSHKPISNEHSLAKLIRDLNQFAGSKPEIVGDAVVIRGNHLHLPEMLFIENSLQLQHKDSCVLIDFSASLALQEWVGMHLNGPVQVLKIPISHLWTSKIGSSVKTEEYDWTWNGPYKGSAFHIDEKFEIEKLHALEKKDRELKWSICESGGLDISLLSDTSTFILFFDYITLFEDFIHDHGEVKLSVKVRVMESCWYSLLRYWLRVDNVTVKLMDTRYFHKFGSKAVFRDISTIEIAYQDLQAICPSNKLVSQLTADQVYSMLQQTEKCSVVHEKLELFD